MVYYDRDRKSVLRRGHSTGTSDKLLDADAKRSKPTGTIIPGPEKRRDLLQERLDSFTLSSIA